MSILIEVLLSIYSLLHSLQWKYLLLYVKSDEEMTNEVIPFICYSEIYWNSIIVDVIIVKEEVYVWCLLSVMLKWYWYYWLWPLSIQNLIVMLWYLIFIQCQYLYM